MFVYCVVWFKMVQPSDVIPQLRLHNVKNIKHSKVSQITALSNGRMKWEINESNCYFVCSFKLLMPLKKKIGRSLELIKIGHNGINRDNQNMDCNIK